MSNKAKLELHHLALWTGPNGLEELVTLCKRNKYPQLSYDKWLVRSINSDRDDLNDRQEVRETELVPLVSLSKDQLRKYANELQFHYEAGHPVPIWVASFFSQSRHTKAELIEAIEKMWDDHSFFYNNKKQVEKQKAARAKEDRENLLQDFRTMNPTTLGMYIPFIIDQLTDDQIRTLRCQIDRDERELIARVGPISMFGPLFPH